MDPTPPVAKVKKLKKLKIMTSKGYNEVKRGSLDPIVTESQRSSAASSSNKRKLEQTDPDLVADEQEPSVKRKAEDWTSIEDVDGLGLFDQKTSVRI